METIKMNRKQDFFYCYNMIFSMDISAHAKLVYTYLCRCANSEAQSFPARKTIGEACNIGLTSVRNALKELVEARLMKKQMQFRSNGGQTSNLYTVHEEPYGDDEGYESGVSNSDRGDRAVQVEPIENIPERNYCNETVGAQNSIDHNVTPNNGQLSFGKCQPYYDPQPGQNMTTGVAKCAHQEVLPSLRSTHNQVRANNGKRIRDG